MSAEHYRNASDFCIEENSAFRWFQGYDVESPVFSARALARMADQEPEVVRDMTDQYPLGRRLLSRLYYSGFADELIQELLPGEVFEPDEAVAEDEHVVPTDEITTPPTQPIEYRVTVLPPVMPQPRPRPVRQMITRTRVLDAEPLQNLQVLFGELAESLENEVDWQRSALCAQTDPEAFFPEKGGSTREAKKVCSGCDVRAKCLEKALEKDERFGVWGGLSERERRKLRRRAV